MKTTMTHKVSYKGYAARIDYDDQDGILRVALLAQVTVLAFMPTP